MKMFVVTVVHLTAVVDERARWRCDTIEIRAYVERLRQILVS